MKVKIKKLDPAAIVPKYAKSGDAGLDLIAIREEKDFTNYWQILGTGLAIEIPKGYVGLIFPRSSIYKTRSTLSNSVGIIDSSCREEIKLIFNLKDASIRYEIGDSIGRLIIVPYLQIELE